MIVPGSAKLSVMGKEKMALLVRRIRILFY